MSGYLSLDRMMRNGFLFRESPQCLESVMQMHLSWGRVWQSNPVADFPSLSGTSPGSRWPLGTAGVREWVTDHCPLRDSDRYVKTPFSLANRGRARCALIDAP